MYIRTHMYTWMYTSTYLHVHIRVKIPCRNYTIFLHVKWFSFFIQQTTSTDALFFSIKTYNWWLVNQNRTRKKKDIKKNEIYKKNRPMGLHVFFLSYTISDWFVVIDLHEKPPNGSVSLSLYDMTRAGLRKETYKISCSTGLSFTKYIIRGWFAVRDLHDKAPMGLRLSQSIV